MEPRKMVIETACRNRDVSNLEFIGRDQDGVDIEEISGDGILNYVFRVKSKDGKESVIMKYGMETAKFNPDEKVTLGRQLVEFEALKILDNLWPGVVPKPYCLDTYLHIIAMEDLGHMHLLHEDLANGKIDIKLLESLGLMFAKLHKSTQMACLNHDKKSKIIQIFGNKKFKEDRMNFRLTKAFDSSDTMNDIPDECKEMYDKFMEELTSTGILQSLRDLMLQNICVVHGDCHPKSVFVQEDKFSIFDLEWMHLGNPSYDIGFVPSWFIINALASSKKGTSKTIQYQSLRATMVFIETYVRESQENEANFYPEVAGFMGATFFSLSYFAFLGPFLCAPLDIAGKTKLLKLGMELMRAYAAKLPTCSKQLMKIIQENI